MATCHTCDQEMLEAPGCVRVMEIDFRCRKDQLFGCACSEAA